MNKILISGLINVETTVRCHEFPISYSPLNFTFNGIETTVSGVASGFLSEKELETIFN